MLRRLTLLLAASVLVAGCGSSSQSKSSSTGSVKEVTVRSAQGTNKEASARSTEAQQAAKSTPAGEITGFGATNAAWNSNHTEDPKYAHEAVYDPDSSLKRGDAFAAVLHTEGRISQYEYLFHSESAADARREILRSQFPTDTHIIQDKVLPTCELILVDSPGLAMVLHERLLEPVAQIELETGSEQPFNRSSVDAALVMSGYPGEQQQKPEC